MFEKVGRRRQQKVKKKELFFLSLKHYLRYKVTKKVTLTKQEKEERRKFGKSQNSISVPL